MIVGSEVKTLDGDLICLFLDRADPARPAGRRGDRGGARPGRAGRHPPPVRPLPGSLLNDPRLEDLAGRVDWVEGWNARVIGREATSGPPSSRSRTASRPSRCRTRTRASRSGSPTRWSTATRRRRTACSRRWRPPPSCPVGHPMSHGPSRRWPSSSSGRAATAESGPSGPMAGWLGWTDDRRDAASGTARTPRRRPARPDRRQPIRLRSRADGRARAPRDAGSPARPIRRPGQRRPAVPQPAAPPAPDDRVDRPAARAAPAVRPGPPRVQARRAAGRHPAGQQGTAACRVPRVLPRLPAARPALGDPHPRDRLPAQGPRLDRDHPHLVARELPCPGQARRRLPGLPAQDQQPGLAQPNLRHRVHRADPRPVRDRRPRPGVRVHQLPQGPPPAGAGRLRDRCGRRDRPRDRAAHDAQLRPPDHRPAAPSEERRRAVRPVRGGRLRGGNPRSLPGL